MTQHRETGTRFEQITEDLLRTLWAMNPVEATILGIHDYDDTLGDMSADAIASHTSALRQCLTHLKSDVNPANLDAEDELNYLIALSLIKPNLIMLERQRPWVRNPSVYLSMCVWGCFSLLSRRNGDDNESARFILSRLRQVPEFLAASKANIERPVPVFGEYALDMIRGAEWFFGNPIAEIAAMSPSLETDILEARDRAVEAFREYGDWLSHDVALGDPSDYAIGDEVYRMLLSDEHQLSYSPEDIVRFAEETVRNAEAEITDLAASIAPGVSWRDLITGLKAEHPPEDGLIGAYRDAFESAKAFVIERGLVTLADGERLLVEETPPFERAIVPYAGYFPPAPFAQSRQASLWVTPIAKDAPDTQRIAQLRGHCIYSIPIIALHEGYPGHHVQLTRAMSSPYAIRKQAMSNLLIEGWAFYCERLMYEQGFYSDPRVRLFQLRDILWRACRVIIDVGLHTGGMTLADAVRLLVYKAQIEDDNAVAEVKRYAMSPTQPMSYMVGEKLLLETRDRAKQRLGSAFDLRSFHDELLTYGSIPVPLIASRINPPESSHIRAIA